MAKENKPRPKRLSVRFIETVKEPGVYGDGPGGNGLQLRVTPRADGGLNKFFQQRLTLKGKPINVGGARTVSGRHARGSAGEGAGERQDVSQRKRPTCGR